MPTHRATRSVRECEAALRTAQLTGDAEALAQLLDDALVFTAPDGLVYGKTDDLDAHRRGIVRITRLDASEERFLDVGHLAVVVVRMEMTGTFHGEAFDGPFRYTRVWRDGPSGWRVVAGHASVIRT